MTGGRSQDAVRVRSAIRGILAWLAAHPDAKDTAEGILRDWLADRPDLSLEDVNRALDQLLERAWLRERAIPAAAPLFALRDGCLPAIRAALLAD